MAMTRYTFTVLLEKDENGMYVAEAPDLKGCYTQGTTAEEAIANIKEVIQLCLSTQKGKVKNNELVGIQKVEVCA